MIEIRAVGGYKEVGKNMTAIRVDDEVVIFDMGLHLPNYIRLSEGEGEDVVKLSRNILIQSEAVPNDGLIDDWKHLVKAICISHAHLDHVGAVPFMANKYNCPIITTPFTANVLRRICKDERIKLKNTIIDINPNSSHKISENLKVDLVNMTHSTPQTATLVLHTKYGAIVYAVDFKLDDTPMLGKRPNYAMLDRIAKKGILLLIIDALYVRDHIKMPSERVAQDMLKDILLHTDSRGKSIIVTTFSSHIARLKAIVDGGLKLGRQVVFLGRSLAKYTSAAEDAGIYPFSKYVDIVKFSNQVRRKLKDIQNKGQHRYLIVATGHQGEPNAILSKMMDGRLPWKFHSDDQLIFSCHTIPVEVNIENRAAMESKLKGYGVRLFKDVHVSGHGAREDMRELIKRLRPKHIAPAHEEAVSVDDFIELGKDLGYELDKTMHILETGDAKRLA